MFSWMSACVGARGEAKVASVNSERLDDYHWLKRRVEGREVRSVLRNDRHRALHFSSSPARLMFSVSEVVFRLVFSVVSEKLLSLLLLLGGYCKY